jgi:hypothetical protein
MGANKQFSGGYREAAPLAALAKLFSVGRKVPLAMNGARWPMGRAWAE